MPATDVTPPDYSSAIGQVRLLIPDTEQLEDVKEPSANPAYIFSDGQIQAFLTLYSNNIKKAAAQAKMTLATSEALINKVISTYDFSTDGAKVATELRAQAQALREEADLDIKFESSETFIVSSSTTKWNNDWL